MDDLRIGEHVSITFDAATRRIARVEPDPSSGQATYRLQPEILVVETCLLDYRIDDDATLGALEDRLFERSGIAAIWRDAGFVTLKSLMREPDYVAAVRTFLEEESGHPLELLVEVSANYPIEWGESSSSLLEDIYRRLPGYHLKDGIVSFFGAGSDGPPYLDVSVEPTGLDVHGVLRRQEWTAWSTAFARHTADVFVTRLEGY